MRLNNREDLQDELIRRMAEPDDLRALRNQKEQIDARRMAEIKRKREADEASRLRGEIRALGHKPVA